MGISDVKKERGQEFKAKGAAIRSNYTDEQRKNEGTKKDTVAFVCCLADPNRKQSRTASSVSTESYTVVGYKLRLLEDAMVPEAPLKQKPETLLDTENIRLVPHKAGEIVALNLVETGAFISQEQYAGQFTGEGQGVYVLAKYAKTRQDPLPALRYINGGSVKEHMEFIADMVGATGDKKGTPVIRDEYKEKFGMLYERQRAGKKGAKGSKAKGEAAANVAAALRDLYADKMLDEVK